VERAVKAIENNPTKLKSASQNDYKRFIKTTSITDEGEIASKNVHDINKDTIANEEAYDGFYAVCTNLEDDASEIIEINRKRWEIEECFRIMKSEFKARPVYLTRDDRISAHFTTCFLSLVLFRYLEKRLNRDFTCPEIINCLRGMNFLEVPGDGYIPTYTRTDLTDSLHEAFNFRTDYQITKLTEMKKIFKSTKK
jgi:IS4 transposase